MMIHHGTTTAGTQTDRSPFPQGFLWGASTSAHQIEGNNLNSDFWAVENDVPSVLPERSGDACDSLHRWPEDLDLIAGLGFTGYRFSLEWSRIVPVPGHPSRAMIEHYRRIIDGCLERGLVPMVTLHHFTNPRWFTGMGGWAEARNSVHFLDYVRAVVPILGDVPWICTINEPNMLARIGAMLQGGHETAVVAGALPPPDAQTSANLIDVHHATVEALHATTDSMVGWSVANQNFQAGPGAEDVTRAWAWPREDQFIDAARDDDFIGVQAYTRVRIDHTGPLETPQGTETTLTGWEYYPEAAARAVRHVSALIPGVPIVVTENGIATRDDSRRIDYTRDSLRRLAETLAEGIDVRGYFHWSLLDNYEWGSFAPTFGLASVDRDTFDRQVKPSGTWLGHVAATNGARL